MEKQRIDRKDVNLLIIRLKRIIKILNLVERHVKSSSAKIRRAIYVAKKEDHATILYNTPVEKINAEKRGIRTGLFRRAGYGSIYSVLQAGTQRLSAIKGVSPRMAEEAVSVSRRISEDAWKNTKVRLNLDHKTAAYNKLISLIDMYRQYYADEATSMKMLNLISEKPRKEIKKLKRMNGRIRWALWSNKRRDDATNTYYSLFSTIDELEKMGAMVVGKKPKRYSPATAWDRFASRPIEYNNILERVLSNKISTDEYGFGIGHTIKDQVESTPILLDGLNCQLRGYQIWGVKYILHQQRVLLGDEMGLGKTIQALAAIVSLRNSGASHFLVLCPASVIENWCREIENKSDMKAYNLHDAGREFYLKSWLTCGGIAVTNYESLQSHFSIPDSFRINMVVVDEAHYIKNESARRSQNVLAVCRRSDRLLFMTGTPLENNVTEMVGLMKHLQPAVAQSADKYATYGLAEDFKEKISPVYYRRKREDVLSELPELLEVKEWCQMTRDDELAYERDILSGSFMQARRVSWSNRNYFNTSAKVQRMRELVEEARIEQRKVLIFSFFLETLDEIRNVFGPICVGVISGSVPISQRQRVIDEFEKAPYGTVLAAQIQSGGTGLNIQTASVVIICEPQYKPSTENQAISRAYRMGQTRNVIVYRLLCPNSVDERVTQILGRKQDEFDTYADESVAARRDSHRINEDFEIDKRTQESIFAEEKKRIEAKRGLMSSTADQIESDSISVYEEKTEDDASNSIVSNAQTIDNSLLLDNLPERQPAITKKEIRLFKKQVSKLICNSCGKQVPNDSMFCNYCGTKLR